MSVDWTTTRDALEAEMTTTLVDDPLAASLVARFALGELYDRLSDGVDRAIESPAHDRWRRHEAPEAILRMHRLAAAADGQPVPATVDPDAIPAAVDEARARLSAAATTSGISPALAAAIGDDLAASPVPAEPPYYPPGLGSGVPRGTSYSTPSTTVNGRRVDGKSYTSLFEIEADLRALIAEVNAYLAAA